MSELQTINIGRTLDGRDGDPNRVASIKTNLNTDILRTQAALGSTAVLTGDGALGVEHVGRRVNISLAVPGTLRLPAIRDIPDPDAVVWLRNLGSTPVTLAAAQGTADGVGLEQLGAYETALLDGFGGAWNVLMRSRPRVADERVTGTLSVGGDVHAGGEVRADGDVRVGGAARVAGALEVAGGVISQSSTSYRLTCGKFSTMLRNDGSDFYLLQSAEGDVDGGYNDYRPFSWNLKSGRVRISQSGQATDFGGDIITPAVLGARQLRVTGHASSAYDGANVWADGADGAGYIGISGFNRSAAVQLQLQSSSVLSFVDWRAASYVPIICASVTQASDARLKKNIETITGAMDLLRPLRGVYYEPATGPDSARQVGVIAQEIKKTLPELVHELGMSGEDGTPLLGVRYQNMVAPLLQGLLETDAALSAALERIAALEARPETNHAS
ncbi:tail fiber domain-containing protein [Paraburkholderia bonniea]|uniref:tail fiber domain-containing protein n=1 Tax=Paraburkholderia bonniea TaxID=2152891 RepID=UPI001290DE63|nr:tail fiber domain-containing protein [Paraburkholderia bonniea]